MSIYYTGDFHEKENEECILVSKNILIVIYGVLNTSYIYEEDVKVIKTCTQFSILSIIRSSLREVQGLRQYYLALRVIGL